MGDQPVTAEEREAIRGYAEVEIASWGGSGEFDVKTTNRAKATLRLLDDYEVLRGIVADLAHDGRPLAELIHRARRAVGNVDE